MSITREESELLDQLDSLPVNEQHLISEVWDFMEVSAKIGKVKLAGDDRAARLEAAMVRFLLESRQ